MQWVHCTTGGLRRAPAGRLNDIKSLTANTATLTISVKDPPRESVKDPPGHSFSDLRCAVKLPVNLGKDTEDVNRVLLGHSPDYLRGVSSRVTDGTDYAHE